MIGVSAGGEGNWVEEGRTRDIGIEAFVASAGTVYAILKAPPPFIPSTDLAGKYQIVFEPGMVLSVDDQGVTYFIFGTDQPGPRPGAATLIATLIRTGRLGPNPEYLFRR